MQLGAVRFILYEPSKGDAVFAKLFKNHFGKNVNQLEQAKAKTNKIKPIHRHQKPLLIKLYRVCNEALSNFSRK